MLHCLPMRQLVVCLMFLKKICVIDNYTPQPLISMFETNAVFTCYSEIKVRQKCSEFESAITLISIALQYKLTNKTNNFRYGPHDLIIHDTSILL